MSKNVPKLEAHPTPPVNDAPTEFSRRLEWGGGGGGRGRS
jgi:hypothetical protein